MKLVKILKRPTQNAAPPTNPVDRVASEMNTIVGACLNRERTRLENMYRARQDALLRAISDVLNNSLERLIAVAAKRETDNLMDAFVKLSANNPEASTLPPVDHDSAKAAREAFATAFSKVALPRFEESMADLLKEVANVVEKQVDERLVQPTTTVMSALAEAADSLRSVKSHVADMSIDPDATDLALVQAALDAGDATSVVKMCFGKSVVVQAKAVSGVLDLETGPEGAFRDIVPLTLDLMKFAAILSMDLSDRTAVRLRWLFEVITKMEDADEPDHRDMSNSDKAKFRDLAGGTISRLTDFQNEGSPTPSTAKDAKFLNRVLKAHLKSVQL